MKCPITLFNKNHSSIKMEDTHIEEENGDQTPMNYLIVRPEKGGILDLFWFMMWNDRACGHRFLETSCGANVDEVVLGDDHRWVIVVSIILRKIISLFGKPLEWTGFVVEFALNLLYLNGNFLGLLYNLVNAKVVIPHRESETFISTIGHLDGRIDLYKANSFMKGTYESASEQDKESIIKVEIGNRGLMDLCIMAAKLAYENVNVVRNVVVQHWKMHFVDFYNCWNDFQHENCTQVFILTDKPKDANFILISFRGTEPFDADDWSTDFDYSWYEIPKLGKVHMGFLEALGLGNRADATTFHNHLRVNATTEDPITTGNQIPEPDIEELTAYYAVRNKLRNLLEEHKNAKFIVTGHSLGGALAILFPAVLLLHEEEKIMERLLGIYTFGQPRVGNRQLGEFMAAHLNRPVSKYLRVVYCNDLVPRLPYDNKTFLFKHFGECVYYDSFYIDREVDEEPNRNYFGFPYLIPEYLNAAWELIRSLIMGYTHGPEYKEGWFSILLRILGLALPGFSAHSPTNYINSVRLGKERALQMSSF